MSFPPPGFSDAAGSGAEAPQSLPQPEGRRRARWGFVVAAAVVLALGVGGAVALMGDGGGSASGGGADDGPERVTRDYITAEATGDCERVVELLSDRVLEDNGGPQAMVSDCEEARGDEAVSDDELAALVDTLETTGIEGDSATVTYAGGLTQRVTIEVTLVDDGDAWKVDDLAAVTGELPEDSPLAAARDHAQAILDGDCEAFLAVLSEDVLSTMGDTSGEQASACDERVGLGSSAPDARLGPILQESEQDGGVVVAVTVFSDSYEAGNNIFYVAAVEEGGGWKVDQVGWSDFPDETGD